MNHKAVVSNVHNFTSEEINDLVSTALEGGINYWCGGAIKVKNEDGTYKGIAKEDEHKIVYASDLIGYGGELVLYDIEDESEYWTLNVQKMISGIQLHCTHRGIPLSTLMDNYDADDADCIVQYGLFNEIVFG